jgi:DNA (cytosine-5)-methyltransferase 1
MLRLEIADLFCGAGGTSQGAATATRRLGYLPIVTAINHWDVAVASHKLNHPDMVSLCESIDNLNPRQIYAGRQLDLLWGSPECTHHSRARGGKPKNEQSRATAHCITRWADALRPKTILVENVPEFMDWGPLDAGGDAIPERKGETFRAWIYMLQALGYTVDVRVLCAADFGDPTIRERVFVQAQAPGRQIRWPVPTHSADGQVPGTLPWRAAREIINWDHPMETAFSRRSKGGGPLKKTTMRRIANGLVRYTVLPLLESGQLDSTFLVPQQARHEHRSLSKPLPTVTTTSRGEGLCETFLVQTNFGNDARPNRTKSLEHPLNAVVGGGVTQGIAEGFIVEVNHGHSGGHRCQELGAPLGTLTAKNGRAIVDPYMVQIDHTGAKNKASGARPVNKPLSTVVTKQNVGIVQPELQSFLVHLRGDSKKRSGARSLDTPAPTVTAMGGHIGLCEVVEVTQAEDHFKVRIGDLELCFGVNFRMLQPDELQLAQGFPAHYRFEGTKTEQVRQIGNAVPCGLSEALVYAAMGQ